MSGTHAHNVDKVAWQRALNPVDLSLPVDFIYIY